MEDENDENMPPSQEDVEKAKLARKARREERANRTRKIKVMEVREIRGETQTSKLGNLKGFKSANVRSPNESRLTHSTKDTTEEDRRCGTDDDNLHKRSHG
jgi:checkpoint serine/threonine-protein kinase